MKPMRATRPLLSILTLALTAALSPAQEINRAIRLRPDSGDLVKGQTLSVYFPDAMVEVGAIGRAGSPPPARFEPGLQHEFLWKSQSEGRMRITAQPLPGQSYTVKLADGLRRADGSPVDRQRWIDRRFSAPPLTISSRFRSRGGSLPQKPSVSLLSNYDIRFAEAAKTTYFQDRDSRERFAAQIILPTVQLSPDGEVEAPPETGSSWQVIPKEALPAGRTVDLIIEGLRDAATGVAIPYVKSIPLGATKSLSLESAWARHHVLEEPAIELRFNQNVDPESVSDASIRIEPEVSGFKVLPGGWSVRLTGEFDPAGSYTVHLDPALRGSSGYAMLEAAAERVEFNSVTPSIYLPKTQYFTRSGLGLNLKFLHANTGPATWHFAPMPVHKIGVARKRLAQDGERLIEQLGLQPLASGRTAAAPTIDGAYRDVVIDGPIASGAYLFEVSAETPSGKLAANRSIVFFNDVYVTQKQTHDELWAKVSAMGDSTPAAGARVRLVTHDNRLLETRTTGADGIAKFPRAHLNTPRGNHATHMLIDAPGGGTAVAFVNRSSFYNTGYPRYREPGRQPVGTVFADRNLYRPGTTAKFKGILRHREPDGALKVASGRGIGWQITEGYRGKVVADGTTITDGYGGWEIEWPTAKDMKLGAYWLKAKHGDKEAGRCMVRVEEYRVPLFEVALDAEHEKRSDRARIRVQSNYFHGGPNAGAQVRWQLDWSEAYVPIRRGSALDYYSEQPLPRPPLESADGELRLDENGTGWIEVPIPEGTPRSRPRYRFALDIDVISPEGQTITDGYYGEIQPEAQVLGLSVRPDYTGDASRLAMRLTALDPENKRVHGMAVEARVFRVEARTVKEQVGENLYRYRNFSEHVPVALVNTTVPELEDEPHLIEIDGKPGLYVVVARFAEGGAPRVSHRTTVAANAPAAYPVYNADGFEIATDKKEYHVGDTAALALEAPFGGKAWVTVETDEIVEQFVVDLEHNASRIDLPIKPDYFPNVYASVYLVRAGGADRLPAERFGRARLQVSRPELRLEVKPVMAQSSFEPAGSVSGEVFVTAGGKPVAGADLTLVAVDEAVLKLGDWELPQIFDSFYRPRRHGVSTQHALDNHHIEFSEDEVTAKGFLIGGGGPGTGQRRKKPRENFLARAYWKTGLRTDADGKASFDFIAPDNLTEFRITAVAMTKDHRFGDGKSEFQVNKRLMVEPALPRFVRTGDEIILRAVARQTPMDEARLTIRCSASDGLEFLGEAAGEIGPLARDVPGTFGVRARVKPGHTQVKVRFDATIAGHSDITDEVEVTLPVHRPGIMQRTGLYGKVPDGAREFVLAKVAPEFWPRTEGEFGLTLSRTPFLPKLQALPEVLEYPHGCFEQRASRLLAYTQLAGLLEYLPELGERHKNYQQRIEEGLRYFARFQRGDGFLPYWSGSPDPNAFVTVQAAWVAAESAALGYSVPENLTAGFATALDSVIRKRVSCSDSTRAFALFVQSRAAPKIKPVDVIEELHLQRDRIGDEARAFLAMAMHSYDVMPAERQLLVREIDIAPKGGFDPRNFYSPTRGKAVAYIAQTKIADPKWTRELEPKVRGSLFAMLDDSRNLSTQENLWLLMAMVALLDSEGYQELPIAGTGADFASPNQFSIAWKRRALNAISEIGVKVDEQPTYYLVDATVLRDASNSKREDRGLRVERVLKNLTDAARLGTADAPFRIGDELLISYRLQSDRRHHYIALVDELPAGLETVNFNLAQVAQFYRLPREAEANTLYLNHSELRDRSANLYFDRLEEGAHSYSMLARVTSAGQFTWPATDVTPMYEPRFGALGGAGVVFATEE